MEVALKALLYRRRRRGKDNKNCVELTTYQGCPPVVFALDISFKVVCDSMRGEGVNSLNVARTMIVNGKIGNILSLKRTLCH